MVMLLKSIQKPGILQILGPYHATVLPTYGITASDGDRCGHHHISFAPWHTRGRGEVGRGRREEGGGGREGEGGRKGGREGLRANTNPHWSKELKACVQAS